ncbi:hypothetical protein PHYSODRAFT_508549, partial [Phytophthora sojae]
IRLSSVLVVTAATFLVSCDTATAATQSSQTQLSRAGAAPVSSSRFLRSARTEEADDESEQEEPEEHQSSHHPLLAPEKQVVAAAKASEKATTKLSKADETILTKLKSIDKDLDRFKQWKVEELTPIQVKSILTRANVKKNGPEWQTYYQYLAAFLKQNHKVN